jgi:hypothetical protein
VTTLAWALWLGGLMALFLFVSHLFKVDRPTAVVAAPRMFVAFERYQIMLAVVALAAGAVWWWSSAAPRRALATMFVLFVLATGCATGSSRVITPRMESLRQQGLSGGPEFKRLHGMSMLCYTSAAGLLAINGFLLPAAAATSPRPTRQRAGGLDLPSTPPA